MGVAVIENDAVIQRAFPDFWWCVPNLVCVRAPVGKQPLQMQRIIARNITIDNMRDL